MRLLKMSNILSAVQQSLAVGLHRRIGLVLLAVSCVFLESGCSTQVKKNSGDNLSSQLRGQLVTHTVGDAKFRVQTTGNAVMAGVAASFTGGLAAQAIHDSVSLAKGQEVAVAAGLIDPARGISAVLAKRLETSLGALPDGRLNIVPAEEAFRIVDATPNSARYILDVRTQDWQANYLRSQWARYGAAYGVKVRLIDRVKRTSVSEGACDYISKSEPNPPDYDELIADSAARIRKYMDTFTERCIEDVWTQMFPASSLQARTLPIAGPVQAAIVAPSLVAPQVVQPRAATAVRVPSMEAQTVIAPEANVLSPQAAKRYQVYLTKPDPKAFAVSENGGSWMAWGESLNPMVKESLAQRALRGCEERSQTRCVLYAVDSKVVYGQGLEPRR